MVKDISIYEQLGIERKELQAQGKLPEWVTTASWQLLKENYLNDKYPDLQSVFSRVSKHAAKYTKSPNEWESRFFKLLWNGWLAASTPVLSNMGTGFGCPVSCSGGVIPDSVYGFYDAQKEAAILSKNGFGTSGYLGGIRPRGSKIEGMKGSASGVLPVFKDFVQVSRDISQGSQRRGAWAGYIEIDHDDFFEILNYISKNPDDANIGWNISDQFIERLDAGDKDAIERYQKALKLKMITGKGYFEFIDKVNRQNPQMYKDLGLTVKASNLCFSGDTLVAVADGRNAVSIEQLAIESNGIGRFPVYSSRWNNHKKIWVNEIKTAIAFKTGEKQLIKVTLSDGSSFKCTPDHAIALKDGTYIEAALAIGKPLQPFYTSLGDISLCATKIEYVGIESVYDLTVEDNHNFNIITSTQDQNYLECSGILVHNCSEIQLFSDDDHTFSCVLSSMNAAKYDEWKDTTAVFDATVFLDCVNQDLIEIGKNINGMDKVVRFAEKSRALGLGLLGFHTYLQDNMIPFESMEAYYKNTEIFKHLDEESLKASEWMAKVFGEPKWCVGYGVRNTHRIAIAPNLSSAIVCGAVSQGIEPIYKNAYVQNTAAGKIDRVNPSLLNVMKNRNVYSEETVKDIIANNGSVRHVDWLNDDEKEVFKTAFEINQKQIIRLASARQRFIDQAQSINLFFSADEDEGYISEVHKMAFKDPYIKSLYYIRSETGVMSSKDECLACHS
jgi:ribonucleotide reductase alpha subunit